MIRAAATAVELSKNAKTGEVSATYAAQISCPTSCPLMNAGCYAESGRVGIATRQLARSAVSAEDTATVEAAAIDRLSGRRPLRLHVVGDCATDAAARTVSAAGGRYSAREGSPVWTYTHAWRTVARASWGTVAVRASVETVADIPAARALGYPVSVVVAEHPVGGRAWSAPDGTKVIPCAEQTRGRSCVECRMCWERPDVVIAFALNRSRGRTRRTSAPFGT